MQKSYLLKRQFNDNFTMIKLINEGYTKNPNIFSKKAQGIIKQAYEASNPILNDKRWANFDKVTDRLNSPYLIGYYEKHNFEPTSKYGAYAYRVNAKTIFKDKIGNCMDYTAFSVHCLNKAGYNARAISVKSPTGQPWHAVCEFKDKDNKLYIMDYSMFTGGIVEKEIYTKKLPQIGIGYHP